MILVISEVRENLSEKIIAGVPILKLINDKKETVYLSKLKSFQVIICRVNESSREILEGYELVLDQLCIDVAIGEVISCLLSMGVICSIDEISDVIGHAILS